jgi:hypothetical protein
MSDVLERMRLNRRKVLMGAGALALAGPAT